MQLSRSSQNKEKLNMDEAIIFLADCSYKTTRSKLYKLAASGDILSYKVNGKLIFHKKDLKEWAEETIDRDESRSNAAKMLAEDARKKLNKVGIAPIECISE